MKPIQFPEANVVFAKDQPEYQPLPAHRVGDETGTVITCWELSDEEIETIVRTKKMWLSVYSFNKPLVPLLLTVNRSDLYSDTEVPTMTETEISKNRQQSENGSRSGIKAIHISKGNPEEMDRFLKNMAEGDAEEKGN